MSTASGKYESSKSPLSNSWKYKHSKVVIQYHIPPHAASVRVLGSSSPQPMSVEKSCIQRHSGVT